MGSSAASIEFETAAAPEPALIEFLLRLGDNTLILAHRVSEWCGHAPALEEDIALANTALDLLGQTQLWLGLAGDVEAKGRNADHLAYFRDGDAFRNLLLVEQPNGDYGMTLMRQFLFDAWHLPMLQALQKSPDKRVADIAEKAAKEVTYHLARSTDLVIRLGDGTSVSHLTMQAALFDLWPFTGEFFMDGSLEDELVAAGIGPSAGDLRPAWDEHINATLKAATLSRPESSFMHKGGKRGVHSEHLGYILSDLQFLQRAYPGATW